MPTIAEGAKDLRYLLSRGYPRSQAVQFVANRYGMGEFERLTLFRCVYSEDLASEHTRKLVPASSLRGRRLSIDGFNVLRTVHAALKGHPLYLCDDGFVRDISVGLRKASVKELLDSLQYVIKCISGFGLKEAVFIYDRPVSRSGEISKITLSMMIDNGVFGTSKTSLRPDSDVLSSGEVVATSDSAIIDRVERVFDLGGHVVINLLGILPAKI